MPFLQLLTFKYGYLEVTHGMTLQIFTQIITITNNANHLPLGADASLHRIYAGQQMEVSEELDQEADCAVSSTECGLSTLSSLNPKTCSCDGLDEFAPYENHLTSVVETDNLNTGHRQKSCSCLRSDRTCSPPEGKDIGTFYGLHNVINVGTCADNDRFTDSNTGTQNARLENCSPRPRPQNDRALTVDKLQTRKIKKDKTLVVNNVLLPPTANKDPSFCQTITLEGSNVYNFFEMPIERIGDSNIIISAPLTSIILINLTFESTNSLGYTPVDVQPSIDGIKLEGGIPANRILWNAPFDYDINVPGRYAPFNFYGTLLGRRGEVRTSVAYHVTNTWHGQLFANRVNAKHLDFECGHFVGFASCDLEVTSEPSEAPVPKPVGTPKKKNKQIDNVLYPEKKPEFLRCQNIRRGL